MEVSKRRADLSGEDLIQTVVSLIDLPSHPVEDEIYTILEQSGQCAENVTIQNLREVLVEYLEALNAEYVNEEQAQFMKHCAS